MKQITRLVTAGVVTFVGVFSGVAGTRTISDVGGFGDSFTAGYETISYTGPAATYGGSFTANPGSNHGTTVEVTNPDAALTLTQSAQSSGGLVKTGPGELVIKTGGITYAHSDVAGNYWSTYSYVRWTDGAVSNCYPSIAVVNGTLTFDAPRDSADSVMPDSVIGLYDTSSPAPSATMKVLGGTVNFGNSLTINRGVGTESDHPASTLYVTTNAYAKMDNLWMLHNGIGNTAHSGNAFLDIDGGRVTVINSVQFGRVNGNAHILVRNGGRFEQTKRLESAWYADKKPTLVFSLPNTWTANVNTTFEVTGCSTARIESVANTKMTHPQYRNVVKVHDGGVLQLNNTSYMATNGTYGGFAEFNGATLAPLDFKLVSNWFTGLQNYDVGAGGLTITNDTLAYLGGTSTGSGQITKTGSGMLSLHPGSASVNVRGGGIRLLADSYHPETAFNMTGTVTAASETLVEIVGKEALGHMTLAAGEQKTVFRARGLETEGINGWEFDRAASFRYDGWMKANETRMTEGGSFWRKDAVDVTRSFTLSFDMCPFRTDTTFPYGFSVVWQNTAAGRTLPNASVGRGLCYRKVDNPCPNSYAIGFDVAASLVRFARSADLGNGTSGGYFLTNDNDHDGYFALVTKERIPSATEYARFTYAYDADAQRMVFTITRFADSVSKSFTNNVNLAARCGGGTAYLRLSGQSSGASDGAGNPMQGEYLFGNIKLNYETPAATRIVAGGKVAVPNGGTFTATVDEDPSVKTWTVDELARSGDATLDVSGAKDACLGFSSFSGTGNIVKTGAASLGIGMPLAGNLRVENGGLAFFPARDDIFAPTSFNWKFSKPTADEVAAKSEPADGGGVFVDDDGGGFALGRTSNLAGTYSDNVNTTHRVYVGGRWKLSYRLKVSSNTNYGLLFFSLFFHNDPLGPAAKGTSFGATEGIRNGAYIIWSPHATQGSEVNNGVLVCTTPAKPTAANSVIYSPVSLTAIGRKDISDPATGNVGLTNKVADVTLTYDPVAKNLNMKMYQADGGHEFDHDFAIDIPAAVGGDYAYIGFGTSTPANWFNVVQTITNMKFDDGTSRYIDGTLALTQATTPIRLEGAAGQTNCLATTITVPAHGRLVFSSPNGVKATADSLIGDGALAIDGGTFVVSSASTIAGVQELALDNGAALDIPAGVTVKMRRLTVDGMNMGSGCFTDEAPFVSGGGRLLSGNGLTVIIR